MGGLQGLLHDLGQVVTDGVQVHGVLQARREGRDGQFRVVPGPVEAAVRVVSSTRPAYTPISSPVTIV
jgi:hypothetical protein